MSILIRPLEDLTIPAIFNLMRDSELYRYLPLSPPKSFEELAQRFEVDVRPEGQLFIVHLEGDPEQPIGFCRYRVTRSGKCEIGYMVGHDYWGKGYATRLIAMLLDELSGRFGGVEVIAQANVGNVGSIRALEKNGFLYSECIESILNREASYELEYSRILKERVEVSDSSAPQKSVRKDRHPTRGYTWLQATTK